jgi:hypothetical protein
MFDSRRRFLSCFGVGIVGAGAVLFPNAAQACGRRRGVIIGCPPPDLCPPDHGHPYPKAQLGKVTCYFPDTGVLIGNAIPGGGFFMAWGTLAQGYYFTPNGLQLVNTDGTPGTNPMPIPGSSAKLLSLPKTNPWYFQCMMPVGPQFYLQFSYIDPNDTTMTPQSPAYPWLGPFTCGA